MKFCDKLQKIRKENNITQEQLADRLNVSRQAVSKWESGTAYPDTEKLIQISKLFKVSLDDLINDNSDLTESKINKKINFLEMFNNAFEEVRKVFSMFFAMKFKEKLKFLIEMFLVVLAIIIVANIADEIIMGVIRRIFAFLPYKIYNIIDYLVFTILYIMWLVLGVMVFMRVLKIRYLDYYVMITDDTIENQVIEEPIRELKEKKDYKVVIRDPKDSAHNFLSIVVKVFIFFFKLIGLCLIFPAVICFILGLIALVINIVYVGSGLSFTGLAICLLGGLVFTYLIIEFLFKLIFNQTLSFKKLFAMFILSLIFIGLGSGLFISGLNEFEIVDAPINSVQVTKEITMDDKLVFEEITNLDKSKITIDDKLENIKIDLSYSDVCDLQIRNNYRYHDEELYNHRYIGIYEDEFTLLKKSLNEIKHKKVINNINCDYEIDKVTISSANLAKLKANYQKTSD